MTDKNKRGPTGASGRAPQPSPSISEATDIGAASGSEAGADSLPVNDPPSDPASPAQVPPSTCTLAEAMQYARKGVRLLPLHSVRADGSCTCGDPHDEEHGKKLKPGTIGKHPRIVDGFDASSTDRAVIQGWFDKWPVMNLGGFPPPGVVIVDIDPRNGGRETWDHLRADRPLPITPMAYTGGGGGHLWARAHDMGGKLGAGIDLISGRKYVVLPPSNHVKGAYRWKPGRALGEVEIAIAPDWLQSAMVEAKSSASDDDQPGSLLDKRGTERDLREVIDALTALPSTDYNDDWIPVGAAMRRAFRHDSALGERARVGWTRWSIDNYDGPGEAATEEECGRKWFELDTNRNIARPMTIATIIWRAKRAGWIPERVDVRPDEKGNARWLVRNAGDQFLTAPGATKDAIFAWTGLCWQHDLGGARIYDTLGGLSAYWEQRAAEDTDPEARKLLLKHAAACRKRAVLGNTNWHVARQSELMFDRRGFDAAPNLLGCANGVLDLTTGVLHPHHPKFLLTKLVDVAYDPDAECEEFERFIETTLGGDKSLIKFVQRVLGYVLTGYTREQALFFMLGPSNSGKSTLMALLRDLLGVYAYTIDSGAFMANRGSSNYSVANIPGTRLVIVNELPRGKQFNTEVLKALTGGDEMEARMIFQEPLRFEATCKIVMVGNERPTVPPGEDAFWRRVVVLPFDHVVPPAERDPGLVERLRAELPGILAWLVRGCMDWQAQGLANKPQAVLDAIAAYRAEADPAWRWHDACCVADPHASTLYADLFNSYTQWCSANGVSEPMGDTSFQQFLSGRGYTPGGPRSKLGRKRKGVRLAASAGP